MSFVITPGNETQIVNMLEHWLFIILPVAQEFRFLRYQVIRGRLPLLDLTPYIDTGLWFLPPCLGCFQNESSHFLGKYTQGKKSNFSACLSPSGSIFLQKSLIIMSAICCFYEVIYIVSSIPSLFQWEGWSEWPGFYLLETYAV